jgi:hypothetical protein
MPFCISKSATLCKNWIIALAFKNNGNLPRRKLAKIAESSDHNIDPRSKYFTGKAHLSFHSAYNVLKPLAAFSVASPVVKFRTQVSNGIVHSNSTRIIASILASTIFLCRHTTSILHIFTSGVNGNK